MTNLSAGVKRAHEDRDSNSGRKRQRDDSRDWKDTHLKNGPPRNKPGLGYDRRDRDRERDSRDRGRERHHRSRDRPRSRDRREMEKDGLKRQPEKPHQSHEDVEEGEIASPPRLPATDLQSQSVSPLPVSETPAEPQPEIFLEDTTETVDEDAARRARHEKWKAMRARASNLTPVPSTPADSGSAVLPPNTPSSVADPALPSVETPVPNGSATETAAVANDFDLAKGETQLQEEQDEGAQIMAGDYDPSMDRREDEQKRVHADDIQVEAEAELEEEVEIEEDEDDVDDMFAAVTSVKPKVKRVVKKKKPAVATVLANTTDSAADPEGYYNIILAEQLDGGRYQVFSHLGKGMFASVVRARVLKPEQGEAPMREVAIKIVRSQESMYKSGLKEAQILQKLQQADVDDKRHLVRLERTFEHRGHLCLVFESLSMNLREVVKRFGKDVGLNLKAVRAYSHQLFIALNHLKKVGVVHADIKPDNILVNEAKNLLKLCDLGSASDAAESEITPYLVSRFYRAPEIIMGYPYDSALDVWSAGCTLYELYTGKILLPGRSNNHMLLLMMELKGRFNSKMIKKAQFGDVYFDDLGAFSNVEHDRVTGMDVIKKVHISKPSRELKQRLLPSASVKMKDDESKLLMSFIDFLEKCLVLDPAKRMTAKEALAHPFIRG